MANNEDTLLREVEEELRRERMEQIWKQYGTYLIAAAALVLAGVLGFQYYRSSQQVAAQSAGAMYEKASYLADDGKADEARKSFDELAKSGPAGYAALARLKLASLDLKAGDKGKAVAHYDAVVSAGGVDPLIRSFAKLQAAALKIGDADFTEVENRLNDLAADTSPWRANARELIALSALKAGKVDVARKALEQILGDRTAPADIRERAQILMAEIISRDLAAKPAGAPAAQPASAGSEKGVAAPK